MGHIVAAQDDEFAATSEEASDALLAFAATGNPGTAPLPWPAFSTKDATMVVFDTESTVREPHEVDLYRHFAAVRAERHS